MAECKHQYVRREAAGGRWLEWCLTCLSVREWHWIKEYNERE
jgi:hypothetical protein